MSSLEGNAEYVLDFLYVLITGTHLFTSAPADVSTADISNNLTYYLAIIIRDISALGLFLAFCLLVMCIYVRVRIIQVEHTGFHHKDEEEKRKHVPAPANAINSRWDMIVALANSENESDWRRAIIEADIMLDKVLSDRGYTGGTLGEKLKLANPLQFRSLNSAWEAHKVRNAIAHLGEGFPITTRDVRLTTEQYRQVFEELGVL